MDITEAQLQLIQDVINAYRRVLDHDPLNAVGEGHATIGIIQNVIDQVHKPKLLPQGGFGHSRPAPKPEPKKKR